MKKNKVMLQLSDARSQASDLMMYKKNFIKEKLSRDKTNGIFS